MNEPEPAAARRGRHKSRKRRTPPARRGRSERVLVLVSGDDDQLVRTAAAKAGAELRDCRDVDELADSVGEGAGAAVVNDALLGDTARLRRVLDSQRQWSELPIIVLFDEDAPAETRRVLEEFELHARVKLMLLHRPVPPISLASALRSALKSRRRQYEVRDLLARLNKDVRLRDQFLAMLGHELRNPLNSIGYVAEIFQMAGEALTPSQARWGSDVIARQLRHLSRLLDQLLDVARVQRGKIKLDTTAVDLRSVAEQCAESFLARAQGEREFSLTLTDESVLVHGDRLRLTQIVDNLLDNALKYTEEGGCIRLAVEGGSDAVLKVSDDGRGIRSSAVAHVFEPFYQEQRARSGDTPGLGLGLAMVDNLVRLHGGRVAARSEGAGRGAEFELRLPLANESIAEPEPPQAPARAGRLRLLIVEDDADSAEALAMLMESLGHDARIAFDGCGGVQKAGKRDFDLVFIDIGLPDIDGEEVARRIREALGAEAPRLVALTGRVQSADENGRLFDDYLLKPVGRERVEQLLGSLK